MANLLQVSTFYAHSANIAPWVLRYLDARLVVLPAECPYNKENGSPAEEAAQANTLDLNPHQVRQAETQRQTAVPTRGAVEDRPPNR